MRGGVENYYEEKVLTLSFVLASCVNLSALFCLSAGGWGVWLQCCVCLLLFVSWGLGRLAAVLCLPCFVCQLGVGAFGCSAVSALFCLSAGGWGVWLQCCVCLVLFISWGLGRLAAVLCLPCFVCQLGVGAFGCGAEALVCELFPSSSLSFMLNCFLVCSFLQSSPASPLFNPFTAQTCKVSGLKSARTRQQTVYFSGPVTNLSSLCVLMQTLSRVMRKRKQNCFRI